MSNLSVRKGLLPLKLNTGADKRELDRAKLLIGSLGRCWRGPAPFELHIVALNDEIDTIRQAIAPVVQQYQNIKAAYHNEGTFFGGKSDFYKISGTYKQQLIKLLVPPALQLGPFITFDADIVCIRPFDEHTFVCDGKLISTWEARHFHAWWENSMGATRIWADMSRPGLGVTPNVLHSEICSQVSKYFVFRNLDALEELYKLTVHHPYMKTYEHEKGFALVWSEYSLYTLVGEWFGSLYEYHLTPEETAATGVHLHSMRSVWAKESSERLTIYKDHPGYFVIVQSWAGISVEEIASRLGISTP